MAHEELDEVLEYVQELNKLSLGKCDSICKAVTDKIEEVKSRCDRIVVLV